MISNRPSSALVWGTATLMVAIVSCCSLIGVSIMPLISGPSYKVFITMFTGLAVGSLLGSAIFSLIPQAFGLHLQPDKTYLWKSLMIFFGVYLFYISERLMRMYFENRNNNNKKIRQEQQLQLKRNKSNDSLADRRAGDQGDTSKCNDHDEDPRSSQDQNNPDSSMTHVDRNAINSPSDKIVKELGQDDLQVNQHHHFHHHHDMQRPEEVLAKGLKTKSLPTKRSQIAPVAWMIIIGDGLHNFIDGLSIGAAFTESILLGVSTSVAVIFEEFPHELGDFAVLISSGMTVKQALCYNFLSALTCFIGMIFGILLGDLTQSASYIFALAGGMFLYISLVDMMGELSAMLEDCKESTREVCRLLLMQNVGLLTGIIIIFILSMTSNG